MNSNTKIITTSLISISFVFVANVVVRWVFYVSQVKKSKNALLRLRDSQSLATPEDVPGLAGYPFVGLLPDMLPFIRKNQVDVFLMNLSERFGELCRFPFNGKTALLIGDAAIAKKILNSPDNFIRGPNFQIAATGIAPHALFVLPSGEQWKRHRKGLQPAFGPVHLRHAFAVCLDCSDDLVNVWKQAVAKASGTQTRNIHLDFTMLTSDVIGMVGFSANFGSIKSLLEKHDHDSFYEHAEKVQGMLSKRTSFVNSQFLWPILGLSNSNIKKDVDVIQGILQQAINQKNETKNENHDLLDRLLADGKFSEDEIKSEALGFFLAGHDTTTNSLTWAILELANNPHVKEKLVEEIDRVLCGEKPNIEHLTNMKYLDAFTKEIMRFRTVVTANARKSDKDTVVTGSDGLSLKIPRGTVCILNVTYMHLSEKYWGPDAKLFSPERWLVKSEQNEEFTPVPGSFMPFGDGQMNCIGQKMAIIEMKTVIIRMLQFFDFKASPNQGPLIPVTTITRGLKNGAILHTPVAKSSQKNLAEFV
ncbi:hypothetical protein HK096_006939 [Nowakowskiella sp. JEL0078]|nr:hypothetical protein HK096_006939 [Nowakowskiella sp. JEL0078]